MTSVLRRACVALPTRVLLPAVLTAAALAGCSASTAPDGTAAARAPMARHTDGALPDVRNPTDLAKAPVIGTGQGSAPTGLVTRDLVTGRGAAAGATSTVTIRYVGARWRDGKVFDTTWADGQSAKFPLAQVIPGFRRGISGMQVGGRREISIPPALGYGPAGGQPPTILADDTLVFVVDLLSVTATGGSGAGTGSGGGGTGGSGGTGGQQ